MSEQQGHWVRQAIASVCSLGVAFGGLLCVVGAFLPWVETDIDLASLAGPTVYGLETDGITTLTMATVSMFLVLVAQVNRGGTGLLFTGILIAGALIVATAVSEWVFWEQWAPAEYGGTKLDIREGVFITLLGGALITAFSVPAVVLAALRDES